MSSKGEYEDFLRTNAYRYGRLLADTWCSAFVWKKHPDNPNPPVTENQFRSIESNPWHVHHETVNEIERLRQQYHFFHWHLEFPDVFLLPEENQEAENQHTGWNGGFDVMLSNPWERVKLQEKEWFASRDPEIANAPNAASRKEKSKPLKLMILHSFMHLKKQFENRKESVTS